MPNKITTADAAAIRDALDKATTGLAIAKGWGMRNRGQVGGALDKISDAFAAIRVAKRSIDLASAAGGGGGEWRPTREQIGKLIWDTFCARLGGPFRLEGGSMAHDTCMGLADAILALPEFAALASTPTPAGEEKPCSDCKGTGRFDDDDQKRSGPCPRCGGLAPSPSDALAGVKEALEPFAAAAFVLDEGVGEKHRPSDDTLLEDALWPSQQPTVGDLRRAARALSLISAGQGEGA